MQSLLEGKRVFRQESPNERFLLLDSSKFYKFFDLYMVFGIKKGDLLHPKKWTDFGTGEFLDYCRKTDEFNVNDYEMIVRPENFLAKDLNKILNPHGINVEYDWGKHSFNEIEAFPKELEEDIRKILLTYHDTTLSEHEAFLYNDGEKDRVIATGEECGSDDIDREYTEEFKTIKEVERYKLPDEETYLIQVEQKNSRSGYTFEKWLLFYPGKHFDVIKEVYEIEDLIPFTEFNRISPVSL